MAQLNLIPQSVPGVVLIKPLQQRDVRGEFVKTFHAKEFADGELAFEMREEFFSMSRMGVLRGMHFQSPPFAHRKLVTCLRGRVVDVVLDIRRDSPTYGESIEIELSETNRLVLFMPIGVAHGFLSLCDDTCVVYKTDREHAAEHDLGIRWDSFGYQWPLPSDELLISERDRMHPRFEKFTSPFPPESI